MTTRIASALSTAADTAAAAKEAVGRLADELESCDLAVLFVSPDHVVELADAVRVIRDELDPAHLIGCSGESIVGDGREVEEGPALSLWGASLPGMDMRSFHSTFVRTEDNQGFAGFPDPSGDDLVVLLGDPFTYPAHALLAHAGQRWPELAFVGGMASGGREPGEHRLVQNGDVHATGAVGVTLRGDVRTRQLVSQGCRPIGRSYVVTAAEDNVIQQLGGQPAVTRLEETLEAADPREREMFRSGPHVGIVTDEYKENFERGDFLVRGLMGADPNSGAIVVGETVEVGRTVQFHVRDAETADEDLRALLAQVSEPPTGGLLFTCNGRGSRLFAEPDHDITTIRDSLGDIPVSGFFCQGEIGPVGPRSFLHGFTASVVLFG